MDFQLIHYDLIYQRSAASVGDAAQWVAEMPPDSALFIQNGDEPVGAIYHVLWFYDDPVWFVVGPTVCAATRDPERASALAAQLVEAARR